ncbi:hypothetical protein C8F04DRAFT_1079949 [Mycena alexandri]|uniref:Uncharacterized protein n=1 Tax=Mycena alexandri TaxID=1745969 RepID=A0AAD6TBJ4_9AGAR|nr:hypothetical protein C8F04DRAFT_1079949 [Mycena alexandri]
MKLSTSVAALLSLASAVVSSTIPVRGISSCIAQDRVLVETHNVTAGGHKFQVSTKACSEDALSPRPVEKRVTFNSCAAGETTTFTCVTNQGVGPLSSDCTALSAAIVSAFEQAGDPTLFTVSPQFVQEFTLGTCLYAWINQNPVGGATLQCSYSYVTSFLAFNLDESCILPGDTGGFTTVSNPQLVPASLDWNFEVLHS